ncbi:MAG: D-alanyl-D-alanine carboxypeptidase [Oscillospiraceae bacterium]|jgi:D-alanyl-D-alanine carboxypeptidase (penicillin-binding protein 5/6)|nr:D-alanyl-D-alanine carboxypeptidase [Oscillospiraceae bacterium]
MLKRIITFILAVSFVLAVPVGSGAEFMPDVEPKSDAVFMVNIDTDICVYQKNATKKEWPASITKIMAALVVLDTIKNLDEEVKISYDATDEFWTDDRNKRSPSNAALEPGQKGITFRDCLYALLIASACEAANILAINTAGSIEGFADMMNATAARLGCVNTHFSNAHGLYEPDNWSCAYDMYIITRYTYETYPEFARIISSTEHTFPANTANPQAYVKRNTNKLIQNTQGNEFYYEPAFGVKTGSFPEIYDTATGAVSEGVATLVSMAEKGGFTYILVTLGAPYHSPDDASEFAGYSFQDHIDLYNWAFGTLSYRTVISKDEIIASINVLQGENADQVQLKPATDFATLLPKVDGDDKSLLRLDVQKFEEEIVAPVKQGSPIGRLTVYLANEPIGVIDLVAAYDVERSQTAYAAEQAKRITQQPFFKALVAIIIFLIIAGIVVGQINRVKKAKARAAKRKSTPKY